MSEPAGIEKPGSLFPELPALKITRWRPKLTVEAVHLDDESDYAAIAAWCGGVLGDQGSAKPPYGLVPAIRVWTGHGNCWATEGDWIVRGTHAWNVYEATFFADSYDPAEDSQ